MLLWKYFCKYKTKHLRIFSNLIDQEIPKYFISSIFLIAISSILLIAISSILLGIYIIYYHVLLRKQLSIQCDNIDQGLTYHVILAILSRESFIGLVTNIVTSSVVIL